MNDTPGFMRLNSFDCVHSDTRNSRVSQDSRVPDLVLVVHALNIHYEGAETGQEEQGNDVHVDL